MKKKIKDLSYTEAKSICWKNKRKCEKCPLNIKQSDEICFLNLISECILDDAEEEIEVE